MTMQAAEQHSSVREQERCGADNVCDSEGCFLSRYAGSRARPTRRHCFAQVSSLMKAKHRSTDVHYHIFTYRIMSQRCGCRSYTFLSLTLSVPRDIRHSQKASYPPPQKKVECSRKQTGEQLSKVIRSSGKW